MKIRNIGLLILTLMMSLQIKAQDVIYRKSGEVLKVTITGKTLQSRSFRLLGDADTLTHYISTSLIDSILYRDGTKEVLSVPGSGEPLLFVNPSPEYDRFMVGLDAARLIVFGCIPVSFELLMAKGRIGVKSIQSFGTTPDYLLYYNYSGDFERSNYNYFTTWNSLTGLNGYLFPGKRFRAGTGFYLLNGKLKAWKSFYDEQTGQASDEKVTEKFWGILWSLVILYKYNEHFGLNIGMDTPLYMDPLMNNSTLRCELLIAF